MKKKLKVLGVCNGQGVGLFAFKREIIIGNIEPRKEYFTKGNEQWDSNFKNIPLWKSLEEAPDKIKNLDVIIGNPKCGGNSILRLSKNKTFNLNKDEKSLKLFIDSINKYKPKVFLMENLPKLLEVYSKEEFKNIFKDYDLVFHNKSVYYFGNSQQTRIRLIIVGVLKTSSYKIKDFIKVFKVKQPTVTKELINNIADNITGHEIESLDKKLAMYDYRYKENGNLTVNHIRLLWIGAFKDEWKWPIKSTKMSTLPGVYRNKDNSFPMTARKADRQFKENGYPMSPRELARIMGIPDKFIIYIPKPIQSSTYNKEKQYWINKGRLIVTQTFPYEISLWFKKALKISSKQT